MSSNTLFTGEDDWDCPLCMEEMDLSDKNFRPCPCGYQVCRFCWHKIREDGNQRCPACRKVYDEEEVEFIPVPQEEINRMRQKKRAIKEKREAAAAAELDLSPAGVALTNEIVNSRRHLCEFRVVQRNLVYVIGISAKIAHEHILKDTEFFGQFGKIIKIVVNKKNFLATSSGSNPPSASAYITFVRKDDAARAIDYVDGSVYDGRVIRATYGTTKYCSYFLRGLTCQNPGCMYLHEPGEDIQSFTKEQLSNGNHNLHSFIVDKNESANLRQFGTILYNPKTSTIPTPLPSVALHQPSPQIVAPIPSHTPLQSSFMPVQSTTPAPSRSLNDSPKSYTPAPSAPPGLRALDEVQPSLEQEIAVPERVPLINELSTNSFFDRISKMVTSSELEEFASMAPRGLSFFSPKSPPPPPPALSSFFNFAPLDSTLQQRKDAASPVETTDLQMLSGVGIAGINTLSATSASNSTSASASASASSITPSCPSRQSFSFANLPIRSPKPSTSPVPQILTSSSTAQSSGPLNPLSPAPIKSVAIESLFPSDYRPNFEVSEKKVFSTGINKIGPTTVPKTIPSQPISNTSSPASSYSPPSPALKITISGKPIESNNGNNIKKSFSSSDSMNNLNPMNTMNPMNNMNPTNIMNSTSYANKNLFDLLKNAQIGDNEPVEMPSPTSSSSKKGPSTTSSIGPVKVIQTSSSSSSSSQPQTLAELEKMARENKLDSHLSKMEETMFRSRLEAESLETKLKMLFEASAQAKSTNTTRRL